MKILIQILLLFILLFGICYLLGSFSQATFDINKWTLESRSFVGCAGGILSLLTACVCVLLANNKIE